MNDDRLITQKEWNAKLRELRVANERITELEHKVRTLTEAYDNLRADYDKMRSERDRLLSGQSVRQEPVAWMVYKHGEPYKASLTKEDWGDDAYTWNPLYATPVVQGCVSVPRDSLKLAIEFLQFAQDVPTQEQRATELSAELDGLLAASKEKS